MVSARSFAGRKTTGAIVAVGLSVVVAAAAFQVFRPEERDSGPRLRLHLAGPAAERSLPDTAGVIQCLLSNTGTQRLIVSEDVCASCGEDGGQQPLVIQPGQAREVIMVVENSRASHEGARASRYLSNDPRWPRFSLRLRDGTLEIISTFGPSGPQSTN